MDLISLLVALLIFCLVLWCVRMVLSAFGVGDPIASIVYVVFVLVAVLFLLQHLGYGSGMNLHVR